VEAQIALAEANSSLAPDRRISFRIGVHIGDVMVRAGDLFGDGVNIAARLQTLAKPGGMCISGVTYDQVRKVLPLTFTDLGAPAGEEHRRAGQGLSSGRNDQSARRCFRACC
jgi:adenylate cyclase